MMNKGARLVAITCIDLSEYFELVYSFEQEGELVNLKVKADKNQSFPSICSVYECAFLAENEIKDHFGLEFAGLAPDFGGFLILSRTGPATPMVGKGGQDEDSR